MAGLSRRWCRSSFSKMTRPLLRSSVNSPGVLSVLHSYITPSPSEINDDDNSPDKSICRQPIQPREESSVTTSIQSKVLKKKLHRRSWRNTAPRPSPKPSRAQSIRNYQFSQNLNKRHQHQIGRPRDPALDFFYPALVSRILLPIDVTWRENNPQENIRDLGKPKGDPGSIEADNAMRALYDHEMEQRHGFVLIASKSSASVTLRSVDGMENINAALPPV